MKLACRGGNLIWTCSILIVADATRSLCAIRWAEHQPSETFLIVKDSFQRRSPRGHPPRSVELRGYSPTGALPHAQGEFGEPPRSRRGRGGSAIEVQSGLCPTSA